MSVHVIDQNPHQLDLDARSATTIRATSRADWGVMLPPPISAMARYCGGGCSGRVDGGQQRSVILAVVHAGFRTWASDDEPLWWAPCLPVQVTTAGPSSGRMASTATRVTRTSSSVQPPPAPCAAPDAAGLPCLWACLWVVGVGA